MASASSHSFLALSRSSWFGEKYLPPLWGEPSFLMNKGAVTTLQPREGEVMGRRVARAKW